MKKNFTPLSLLAICTLLSFVTFAQPPAPVAGDYRSDWTAGSRDWTTIANWDVYDGTTWNDATAFPTSADGTIFISPGDSIIMSSAQTIDQVYIESGSVLAIFAGTTFTTTLNDGPGTDIEIDGRLYIGNNATLLGSAATASADVNSGGWLWVRGNASSFFSGITTTIDSGGFGFLTGPGTIQNSNVTNNGLFSITAGTPSISGSTFINNGVFEISPSLPGNVFLAGAGSTLNNSASGIMRRSDATNNVTINGPVTFNNAGTVTGPGTWAFSSTTLTNTGTIAPGSPTSTLTVNPNFISTRSTTVEIEVNSTGAVAGTNYDQLIVSGAVNTNLTNANLVFTNNASDPAGTVYTIMSTAGTFSTTNPSGVFATVTKPTNFSDPVIAGGGTTVTITKIALWPLPVVWGDFSILSGKDAVVIQWSTLSEQNASHFVVEYSVDGNSFSPLGIVSASGNSAGAKYSYTHQSNSFKPNNFYRIRQVDFDGRNLFTAIRRVQMKGDQPRFVELLQNPVTSLLRLDIQSENIVLAIHNQSGQLIQSYKPKPGLLSLESSNWARGIYFISVIKEGTRDVLTVVKH